MDIANIDDFNLTETESTREFKFARDVIRYVLEQRMIGLNWTPEGIFKNLDLPEDPDSPFSPEIRAAVGAKLNLYENAYHRNFDNSFPDENVVRDPYIELCRTLRAEFLTEQFSVHNFFRFVVILAKYAGLSYLYGIVDGPQETIKIIVATVRYLLDREAIDDDFWTEMQEWALNPEVEDPAEAESDDTESTETSSESGRQQQQ